MNSFAKKIAPHITSSVGRVRSKEVEEVEKNAIKFNHRSRIYYLTSLQYSNLPGQLYDVSMEEKAYF